MSPPASTLSRQERNHALRASASGAVWWAEVEDVRARIERRRARESATRQSHGLPPRRSPSRRTVTITGRAALPASEMPVRLVEEREAAIADGSARDGEGHGGSALRRRPRRSTAEWLGRRPDRVAAWAVALGFLLVVAGILSAH